MSNGAVYGFRWQKPVGWLLDKVPSNEVAATPAVAVAKKLAFYMGQVANEGYFSGVEGAVPQGRFYRMEGCRGPHNCEIGGCDMMLSGVFGFGKWKFPTGIIHYILDHNWMPPADFLADLSTLPEPPEKVEVDAWCAPNKQDLFHGKRAMR